MNWPGFFSVAALLAAAPVAAEPVSATGRWTVTAVTNRPDMTVTALVDDDPAYLGAHLTIAPGSIAWDAAATDGRGTYDDCARPRFAPAGGALAVACADGGWGPEATLRPLGRDRLELAWYDGGLLTLTRD